MKKVISILFLLGILILFLIFNTPITRLGSGFLIGTGSHAFTYYDLVKEASFIRIIFPNEDDIPATLIYKDPTHNLAVLQLKNTPKIRAKKFTYAENGYSLSEYVYTLGYPWTNTMEDKHELIEGSTFLSYQRDLISINLSLNPVNSGGPLFNSNNEILGMILFGKHAHDFYKLEKSKQYNYAIPASTLAKVIKKLKLKNNSKKLTKLSNKSFVETTNKNIVLIEAH
jgi:serine protease Do